MSNHQKTQFYFSAIVILVLSNAIQMICYERLSGQNATIHNKTQEVIRYLASVETKVENVKDTVYRHEIKDSLQHSLLKHDTVTLKSAADTAAKYLSYVNAISLNRKEVAEMRDSLLNNKMANTRLLAENKAQREKLRDLQVQVSDYSEKTDTSAEKKNFNAHVSFLVKHGKGFRSNKNYVRVENLGDTSFLINHSRYYDKFIRNTENNQVMGQLRSSYNTANGNFSTGPGVELKINRVSLNTVWFWNTEKFNIRNSSISVGGRLDIFRKRL